MQKQFLNKDTLKQFISDNRLNEVVKNLIFQINEFLDKNKDDIDYEPIRKLSDALIINSGKLNGLEHDKIIGILDRETQRITTSEVQNSVLQIIDKLPNQFWNYRNTTNALSYKSQLIEQVEIKRKQKNAFKFDLFVCFSTKDKDLAKPIWEQLRGYGLNLFVSDENLKNNIGSNFLDKISNALSNSQHLLLLASDNSLKSVYIRDEYQAFYNQFHTINPENRLIIIYNLGKTQISDLPIILSSKQIAKTTEQIVATLVDSNLLNSEKFSGKENTHFIKRNKNAVLISIILLILFLLGYSQKDNIVNIFKSNDVVTTQDTIIEINPKLQIWYYVKGNDTTGCYSLSQLGYNIVKKAPNNDLSNNTIWYGDSIDIKDIKNVAINLLKQNIGIKKIEPFRNFKEKKFLLFVGSSANYDLYPIIQIQKLNQINSLDELKNINN